MKVYFDTVGCRLNQAEIEILAARFRAAGHTIIENAQGADLVIVNSCTVTAAAASDSRQKVRQAYNAGAREIIFTGCLATLEPKESSNLPGVSKVVPNELKFVNTSYGFGSEEFFDLEPLNRQPLPGIHKKTRAYIKVQEGCDNFCSYCVTRIARGRSLSIDQETILEEILAAERGGTREVVLTGVNLGSWGRESSDKKNLTWLIRFLLNQTHIERIRLSSIEPWDVDDEIFSLWQNPRMCRHLHLPLQSGSGGVLKRMVRNTTPQQFKSLIDQARAMIPGVAITTDVIVGFPGETPEEFEESVRFVREVGFSGGHVFKFSSREGTAAARLPGRVHGSVAVERSRIMRGVLSASAKRYATCFLNKELRVLWESSRKMDEKTWQLRGWSDNYLQVCHQTDKDRWNEIDSVTAKSYVKDEIWT